MPPPTNLHQKLSLFHEIITTLLRNFHKSAKKARSSPGSPCYKVPHDSLTEHAEHPHGIDRAQQRHQKPKSSKTLKKKATNAHLLISSSRHHL